MHTIGPVRSLVVAVAVAVAVAGAVASSQVAPSTQVVGVGNFLHVVDDVERALTFYHDVIGLESTSVMAPPAQRPFLATPEIVRLYDATGGRYRTANAGVTGNPMRVELVEWTDVDRTPVAPRYFEPSAATLVVTVRDLDATLARVKASGGSVVTTGASPVPITDARGVARAAIVRDPDGFYVRLVQRETAAQTPAAPGNALDIGFAVTVANLEQTVRIFRDVLGFQVTMDPQTKGAPQLALMGVPSASYRRATTVVPGTTLQGEFIEVRGLDRRELRSRPQDPGSAMLRLYVREIDRVISALAAASVPVVTTGGQAVTVAGAAGTQRYAAARLPDNVFVQLVQRPPVPAK